MKRRTFLKSTAIVGGVVSLSGAIQPLFASGEKTADAYTLPALAFKYGELEPFVDEATMILHHTKHHAAYVARLNAEASSWEVKPTVEQLMASVSKYNTATRNHGGGHYNHTFFWSILTPEIGQEIPSELATALEQNFGSIQGFKEAFAKAATGVFGSGWVWLVVNPDGKLSIGTTANQDNPIMDLSAFKGKPILALDVWEHAYYLKHQNKRADYIAAFWNVVNWKQANSYFKQAR
ncbi:MAG TPA: superoxide dismutase [Luteibaculaceae bacterium]|nr:superoxide dismutase [Luteibaculaceae bacterium]